MPMYDYSRTSGISQQNCRDEPDDSSADSKSFKFNLRFSNNTGIDSTVDIEIVFPLNHLINFWRTLEMPLINCEINFTLT